MKVAFASSFPFFRMTIRGPFVRSASSGGGTFNPLPTGTSPTFTAAGLPIPPTSDSSSSYSSDRTQHTNQQSIQSSTSPLSLPATSRRIPSASISTPFSSLARSDGLSTNYKGSEASTDTLTSILPSSHSSMSTGGGASTNGPPPGDGITTLTPPVSTGRTSQNSPTTFDPSNSDSTTSVSSDTSPSPPSEESWPSPRDLPSIKLPSSLPSVISALPSFTSIPPPLTIPTSPQLMIPTSPSINLSILTSPSSSTPTSLPSIPETLTTRTSSPSTTSVTNISTPGQQTSSQQSTSDNPQNVTPQSSQTSSADSPTPTLPTTFPGGSPTTVPGAQSSHIPQSPWGSPVNTSITTGNGFTVSSTYSPTPSDDPVGNPSSTTLHSPFAGVAKNVISTTSLITHSGDTFYSITYTSIGTSTIITYSCFGSTSTLVTLTSTSTSVIRTTTPVPTSGTRSNEALIIGGIVGGVLVLLLLGIAVYYLIRRRRRSRAQQQLYGSDLNAPYSPAEATTMRENHPFSPTYSSVVGEQGASESRGDLHQASNSFGSSAFLHPSIASSPHKFSRSLSGSALHENFDRESNNGDIFSYNESEGSFASAQSFYASSDEQSSSSRGIGIAIGSQSSMNLHSYHTAATMLDAGAHAIMDNDEECYSPTPSPSAFPVPPVNPFLDGVDPRYFVASRAPQICQAVPASSENAAQAPMNIRQFLKLKASLAAAVSPVDNDLPTPKAIRSFNALPGDEDDDDSSSQDLRTPTQSRPQVTPFNYSSSIINPFLRETSWQKFRDDSGGSDSYETVSITSPYPFHSRDKGKGKEYLSADLRDDPKNNRLSNASSALEYPENPVSPETVLVNFINLLLMQRYVQSQCGLAL
ncbi:uncharacterized protein F5147DRAFT_332096 [Suillus discolor]|uniref:Uncharacterized protein n=1 Tax=Suillus discolor TaxID=1912936 RepID=A0A9P7F0S6_9AGAM|nr:uncharacterized protein F5147DRAFT_332096 [Suillus discolor]KAG2099838.1 hypothetical protein F5147DRAFT_332096 [Suillus discolor]